MILLNKKMTNKNNLEISYFKNGGLKITQNVENYRKTITQIKLTNNNNKNNNSNKKKVLKTLKNNLKMIKSLKLNLMKKVNKIALMIYKVNYKVMNFFLLLLLYNLINSFY